MKKAIFRNIAIITAIFIATLSIMLITNYFQVRGTTPLQVEVIETLKQLNDANANNTVLQEQIRQLDLMTRKAYFVRQDHLMVGIYILIGMIIVFITCIRFYFASYKNIPEKDIDPIDEWFIKTRARKYILWTISGITIITIIFTVQTFPHFQSKQDIIEKDSMNMIAAFAEEDTTHEAIIHEDISPLQTEETEEIKETESEVPLITVSEEVQKVPQPVISKVTHNAFRGNNSNGVSSAKGVPVKWNLSNGSNIAWKQEIPRKGYNSPVINGDNVFFSGADNEARELYCFDLFTGEKRWSLIATNIAGSPSEMPKTTEDTGLAASSVATNGKQVCAIFATGDIICANMEGKQLWAKNLGVPDNHYGYASSLLIYENKIFIQYDNNNTPRIIALDITTGNEVWSKNREEKVTWSSPIIANVNNSQQLILMGNPAITAYNPNNGEQLWRVECLTGEVGASACYAEGTVFGASEYSKMVAINAMDGTLLWEGNDYLPEVASPVASKENVYIATSYGVVASYDTKTGKLKKEHELNTEFYSSPIIVDGKIYLISNDGKMHIFSANEDFNLIDSFETGEKTFATPAFTDGRIIVRTENSIYCVATN